MVFLFLLFFVCYDMLSFVLGIENDRDSFFKEINNKKPQCILITNQTGLTQSKERSIDVLLKKNIKIAYIAVPEHGLSGATPAGQDIKNHWDQKTQIPVISLYKNGSGQLIDPLLLQKCDTLLFDIQDCGMRHYTFVSTLYKTLQMAGTYDKEVVIFDRPNFLGPIVAGPLVDPSLLSFISIASIPLRYGLTIGELALYCNDNFFNSKVHVHVVPMRDYNLLNTQSFSLLTHLSPNIATVQSCYGYSFLGVLGEVRPFDIGISTDQAFRVLMLPQSVKITSLQWDQLMYALRKHHVRSQKYSCYSERKKMNMEGLSLFIDDITKVPNFIIILEILEWALRCCVDLKYADGFDKAVGTSQVRELCEKKDYNGLKTIVDAVRKDCIHFVDKAQPSLLYKQKLIIQ